MIGFFISNLEADVKGTNGQIKFDVDSDGNAEMLLNSNGLGIGTMNPSANLVVQGNAIVTNKLNIGGSTSQSNLNLQGTVSFGMLTVSSNTTLDSSSYYLIDSDLAGGNLNLNLPSPAEVGGRTINIKKISSEHEVHILGVIDEDEKITMSNTQNNGLPFITLMSNGEQWYILDQSSENSSGNVVASSNLIHHWKFEDASGSTATDSVNNSSPGAMTSMSFTNNRINGKVGYGLEFDGSADYIDVGDIDEIELTKLTVAFWVRVDTLDEDYDFFVKGPHTTNEPILIWFDDIVGGVADVGGLNTDTVSALVSDGSTMHWVAAPSGTLANTDWNHITVTIDPDSNNLAIYVNGELQVSNNKAWNGIQATAETLRFGNDDDGTYLLDGGMDDIRIYNKVLSAAEIREIYQLGSQ